MKLVFAYIFEHKILKQIAIPFTSEFICSYEDYKLKIESNSEFLSDYYDNVQISAIIGKNGAGKTSTLEFIENFLNYSESSGFLVWTNIENSVFHIQRINFDEEINFNLCENHLEFNGLKTRLFDGFRILKVNNITNFSFNKKSRTTKVIDLSSEYYSKTKIRRSQQLDNLLNYISSDHWSENNQKKVKYSFSFRGWNSTIKKWIRDSKEYSYFVKKYSFEEWMEKDVRLKDLPTKSLRQIERSGREAQKFEEMPQEFREFSAVKAELKLLQLEDKLFTSQIYFPELFQQKVDDYSYCTYNHILIKNLFSIFRSKAEAANLNRAFTSKVCEKLISIILNCEWDGKYSVDIIFDGAYNYFKDELERLNLRDSENFDIKALNQLKDEASRECSEIISLLYDLSQRGLIMDEVEPSNSYYTDNYSHNLELLLTVSSQRRRSILRGLSCYYGVEKLTSNKAEEINFISNRLQSLPDYLKNNIDFGWDGLSSGEFAKISLFSTIYNHLNLNNRSHALIVIDEVDLYLHPEWQRTFVAELIKLIKYFGMESYIQIILSSHSPLIIGDFLSEDIVTLKIEEGKTKIDDSLGFGTKLSDSYLEGMHLNSTYGEHSREKLQRLIDIKVNDGKLNDVDLKLAQKICNNSLREALVND